MKIIFTIGDCNGIGLEVLYKGLFKFLQNNKKNLKFDFTIAGNLKTISEYWNSMYYSFQIEKNNLIVNNKIIKVIDSGEYVKIQFGKEKVNAGLLAAKSIEYAVEEIKNGKYDAMVTMPVSKSVLYKAGWEYPGHTEMLAKNCKIKNPLMILLKDELRVGLVTIHIPLKEVSERISKKLIIDRATIFHKSLKLDFGIKELRMAVLGLNPHAGENGSIGFEEKRIIIPAMKELNNKGIFVYGPFPADGFFAYGEYKNYDGILAMYHDQGLIPLKLIAKGAGVNYTAGLPIIRTSPDHGTGFAIAGKGIADGESVLNSIITACQIYKNHRK